MLTNSGARTAKISRDVSNFIITQVLERSDDLIKNSYRRLTTENVARNEHWSRIAENVTEKFDIPAEMERVKSHFHNRKKVLLARIKDELRTVPNSALWTTDEKLDELVRRRICIGEYDEQLARVCLDIEEEEKGRTESFGNDSVLNPVLNLFTETSHQSLLSQLLSSSNVNPKSESKHSSNIHSPLESASSRDSESQIIKTQSVGAASRAPLLRKLLSDASTSKENGILPKADRSIKGSSGIRNQPPVSLDRKRRAASPFEKNNRSSVFQISNGRYLSHLIVDVESRQELKRLLSVLIDNGFTRFQHVTSSDVVIPSIREGIHRATPATADCTNHDLPMHNSFEREESPYWATQVPENEDNLTFSESHEEKLGVINRGGQLEVKIEPCVEEDEELDEDVDEHTAELEAQLASEALKNGLALFGKAPSPKKCRISGNASNVASGETVTANCEMCGTVIRLNSGGSKWNFYEHVMMKHSVHKPFKCPHCPYQAGRKVRVKQHGFSQHNVETEPIDMITPEIRSEWLTIMSKCFPDHQYGKNVRL
uniref:LIn-8 Domain containing n=1 Tax=Caenorhabditis tropicalis TaxID=1561998 RepID=A0A1I7TVX5_9PELO